MTQLLLFDPPTTNAPTLETPMAGTPVVRTPAAKFTRQPNGKRAVSDRMDDHQPGLHRMGDLARLVLMRHDMVAKRRAELSEKRRRAR